MTNLADLLPAGGGQNNTDFVADGAISSGAPVILTAAGKAAPISGSTTAAAVQTEVEFLSSATDQTNLVWDSTNSKAVVFYNRAGVGFCKVGSLSGSTLTWGTETSIIGYSTQNNAVCFDSTGNKIIFMYEDGSGTYYTKAIVGEISGSSISFPGISYNVWANANNTSYAVAYDSTNDRIVFAARVWSNYYGTAKVASLSGTALTFGTAVVFESATTDQIGMGFDSTAGQVLIAYRQLFGSPYPGTGVVGTVSSGTTTITFGGATVFNNADSQLMQVVHDPTANKNLVAFYDSTTTYSYGVVATLSGTGAGAAVAFGTPVISSNSVAAASNQDRLPVVYNAEIKKPVFVYQESASPYNLYYAIGTITTPPASSPTIAFSDHTLIGPYAKRYLAAVYDPATKQMITAFRADSPDEGQSYVFNQAYEVTNLTSTNLLGIASGAISDTATGTINTWGSRNEVQTGLTIGSDYYVQTDGRIEAGVTNIAFDISSATYTQNFDISSQATIPQAIAFNPTGTKMFIVDIAGQDVNEYALSTGFDVSSASYTQNFSVASQDTAPSGISFNAAGTKMFVCGYTNDKVYEYTLSSGFDLSTASYAQALDVSGQDTLPKDVVFNTDGTKMFVLGGIGEDVNEYTLSAYDISTASFVDSFNVASQESAPDGIAFNTDGTKMFIVGNTDSVFQYNLSSGFDVSTASYASISFSVTSQETGPTGIAFSADGKKMFIVGTQGDDVNQYATTANSFSTTYLIGQAITTTQINIKDYTG